MDPLDCVTRWEHWAVSGSRETLARFIDALDANLPDGWRRSTATDLLPFKPLLKDGSWWYSLEETPAHVGVSLSLEPHGNSELRGGRARFATHPPRTSPAAVAASWGEVVRLLSEGIVPAANRVGARVSVPTPDEVFVAGLPAEISGPLQEFSRAARKVLPLTADESERWHAFTVAAFRSTAAVDGRSLTNWFVSDGWPPETAAELTQRFFDQCRLLTKYTDLVSVA